MDEPQISDEPRTDPIFNEATEDIVIKVEPICYDQTEDKPTTSNDVEEITLDAPLLEFQCPVCKKVKKDARDLKSHSRIHTRNHKCPHCELSFCKTNGLNIHMSTNHGDTSRAKSCMCEICGVHFMEAHALRKHQRNTHEGIKLHPCSFCSESFKDSDSKKAHERRHTGEKPYQCTECEKSFARRNSLRTHKRWHEGVRAFECTICDLRFDKLSRLRNHLISHTKERAFQCDICFKKLARKRSITLHKRRVHNIVTPWKYHLQDNTADESASQSDDSDGLDHPKPTVDITTECYKITGYFKIGNITIMILVLPIQNSGKYIFSFGCRLVLNLNTNPGLTLTINK